MIRHESERTLFQFLRIGSNNIIRCFYQITIHINSQAIC